ncbi:MAG: hypothetical protein ACRDNG_15020 [Gaiellaceae bacterium]
MRRGGTVLVVVVVAAIALAAGFDALRGDSEPEQVAQTGTESEPPTTSTTQTPAEAPELGGVLYYTDERCELQAVELPGQTPVDAPNWDECRFVLSPDANRASGAGSGWDPHTDPLRGRLFESEDGFIQVSTNGGPEGEQFQGTAPAWHPDGTLTYFDRGALRAWPAGNVVLSQSDMRRAMRRQDIPELRDRFRHFRMREAAWLDDRRLVAIVSADSRSQEDEDLLAVYHGARIQELYFDEPGGLSNLKTSPTGKYFAADASGRRGLGGFLLVEAGRGLVDTLGIAGYRAIAWSPDEQHVAVAADGGVFVFRPRVPGPPELRLDLDARELDWRGEVGPQPLAAAGEARDWLGRVGATGRLFVTVPDQLLCELRALRLPDLVWEEAPKAESPCGFTLGPDERPLSAGVSVSPDGQSRAVCDRGALRIFGKSGLVAEHQGGCAAWMGDGTLTFVRDGGLWRGVDDPQRLVSRERVSELFGRPSALEEVAWVDDQRFWAVVRSGETAIVALLATTDDLVFSPSFAAREIRGLRVSATGMVAARTDQGVVFFDSGGRRALTFPNGRAVAWAPGELIAAVATPTEVLFVAPISREVVPISLQATDLEWVVP